MAQPPRPSMRRKSSAQNLLSGFKQAPNPSTSPSPGPLSIQISNSPVIASSSLGPQSVPMSANMNRDTAWDSQSLQSDSVGSAPLNSNGSPALPQGTSVEFWRDLVLKRMITLTYLRNIHDGRSHWFHTIMLSKADLDRVFNNTAMKKRTYRFAILGMSLSNLFEIPNSQDFLKGLLGTLADYDQSKDDNSSKPKIKLFRTSKYPRRQGGLNDYAIPYTDTSETSYLMVPHMPFPLDYHQTLLSLLDIMSEIYHKIHKILGPSPHPHQHMMGPLGLLSPHPGISYLFQSGDTPGPIDGEGSLWGIANGSAGASQIGVSYGGLASPPPTWTPALGVMIEKVDGKFKKMISSLLKELDTLARQCIRDELASLDPLLRNMALPEDGPIDYEGLV